MNTNDLIHNLKMAWVTAAATIGSGAATLMEWIPTDIGKLASLVGVALTIVLIRLHWRNGNAKYNQMMLEREKTILEISVLQDKENERRAAATQREQSGEPLRRDDDLTC